MKLELSAISYQHSALLSRFAQQVFLNGPFRGHKHSNKLLKWSDILRNYMHVHGLVWSDPNRNAPFSLCHFLTFSLKPFFVLGFILRKGKERISKIII